MCINIPIFPLSAISVVELVSPAAPISCDAITAPVSNNSNDASINSFSRYGSPTCTVGRLIPSSPVNCSLAIIAPPIPSLPVFAPT